MVNDTGSWRILRPITHFDKCTHCLICICAVECPYDAIEMVPEMEIKLKELEA